MPLKTIADELIEIQNEYQIVDDKLKAKRLEMYKAFLEYEKDEIELDNNIIYKTPEREQLRIVNREKLLNILSDKIDNETLIEDIFSEVIYYSKLSPGIRVTKKA
ncbi:MAG: hypothetical protein JJV94_03475 [Sulfurospirillum sp.]|nr:hypothetical protein [Sulfurospirillum sp.]